MNWTGRVPRACETIRMHLGYAVGKNTKWGSICWYSTSILEDVHVYLLANLVAWNLQTRARACHSFGPSPSPLLAAKVDGVQVQGGEGGDLQLQELANTRMHSCKRDIRDIRVEQTFLVISRLDNVPRKRINKCPCFNF